MYIDRVVDLKPLLEKKSVLLFGPRQTGKSTYIKNQLGDCVNRSYNLLDQGLLRRVLADPTLIRQELAADHFNDKVVCIVGKTPPTGRAWEWRHFNLEV